MRRWIALLLCIASLSVVSITAYAHSGRTDSSGGHWNRSTGEYHYHHGYSAHDHYDMDGDGKIDCPYDFKDKTNSKTKTETKTKNEATTEAANEVRKESVVRSVVSELADFFLESVIFPGLMILLVIFALCR